jgi:hypothetical protein
MTYPFDTKNENTSEMSSIPEYLQEHEYSQEEEEE